MSVYLFKGLGAELYRETGIDLAETDIGEKN